MAIKYVPSRIHLLAAKEAPVIVVLQRKRAKLFHVVTINAATHEVVEGSWFRGVLHVMKCDVSFDGKYMVYMAVGQHAYTTWSGLCRLPWLKTLVDGKTIGINWGGGHFASRDVLVTNGWQEPTGHAVAEPDIPFKVVSGPLACALSEDSGMVEQGFEGDGFVRISDNAGPQETFADPEDPTVDVGDGGWAKRPSPAHPELQVHYLGYEHGEQYVFSLPDFPGIVAGASWVTWDSIGTLWVARPGVVEQFTIDDMPGGKPSFSLDVDRFEPPIRGEVISPAPR